MNLSCLTVQIATWPKQYINKNQQQISSCIVRIPNAIEGCEHCYFHAIAKGDVETQLSGLYEKGDYLIIEGYFKLQKVVGNNLELNIIILQVSPITLE